MTAKASGTSGREHKRGRSYRASFAHVATISKSLSRSGRYSEAVRFVCLAFLGIICLKVFVLMSGVAGWGSYRSRPFVSSGNTSSSSGGTVVVDLPAKNDRPLGERLVEDVRAGEFANALAAWTSGPMPDVVVYAAAECTPRDAADAVMRLNFTSATSATTGKQGTSAQKFGGVVDVGANGGYPVTRLALHHRLKWILAVEPDARNFKRLSKLSVPEDSHTSYVAVFGAISDNHGSVTMRFHKDRDDFSCISCLNEQRPEIYTRIVDSWTLDGLLLDSQVLPTAHTHRDFPRGHKDSFGLTMRHANTQAPFDISESILLLKTDTQGHEREVLRGASRLLAEGRILNVIVEFDTKLLRTKENARSTIMSLLDAGMQCAHLRFAGKGRKRSPPNDASAPSSSGHSNISSDSQLHLNPIVRESRKTPFSRAVMLGNIDEFIEFVNATGKYTDLFCSKRPAANDSEQGHPIERD